MIKVVCAFLIIIRFSIVCYQFKYKNNAFINWNRKNKWKTFANNCLELYSRFSQLDDCAIYHFYNLTSSIKLKNKKCILMAQHLVSDEDSIKSQTAYLQISFASYLVSLIFSNRWLCNLRHLSYNVFNSI